MIQLRQIDILSAEQRARLEKLGPLRIIVTARETKVLGLVEQSFGLDYVQDRVLVYWSGTAFSILGEHQLDALAESTSYVKRAQDKDLLIFDPLADDCPIDVHWAGWLTALDSEGGRKYDKRNAPFTVKHGGDWQVRAVLAERALGEVTERATRLKALYDEEHEIVRKIQDIINPPEEDEAE